MKYTLACTVDPDVFVSSSSTRAIINYWGMVKWLIGRESTVNHRSAGTALGTRSGAYVHFDDWLEYIKL